MPTILAEDGFRIRIWGPPREHPPPHVHIQKGADGLIVIRLRIGAKPLEVWEVFNVRDSEVLAAVRLVEKHHDPLLAAWRRIHEQADAER